MMSANSQIRFDLKIVFVYCYITPSHYHHCAILYEDIELIKCLPDAVCRVCKIRHILPVIYYKIRGVVCFQLTHFPCDDWENIYNLSYYHHRIGSMNYYPLFIARSWNNGVRCMSFCILTQHLHVTMQASASRQKQRESSSSEKWAFLITTVNWVLIMPHLTCQYLGEGMNLCLICNAHSLLSKASLHIPQFKFANDAAYCKQTPPPPNP